MIDIIAILRSLGGLVTVLGLLVGALWLVRRYKLKWPGMNATPREARLQVVERLALDQRRSILLIRQDDYEHLVLIGPEALLIKAGIAPVGKTAPDSFAAMLRATAPQSADV